MAIKRQQQWLGQMRVDAPHLRAVESAICNDFDTLAGKVMAGMNDLVISGFDIVNPATMISTSVTGLQLNVANGVVFHPGGSESGTILAVEGSSPYEDLDVSSKVIGSFSASQTNYIGLDFVRIEDTATSDLVQFLSADTLTETPRTIPLAKVLDYRIIIGVTDFNSNPTILPLAKVVTDSNNMVLSIEDARNMMFRLGSGGTIPNKGNYWTWPQNRSEHNNDAARDIFSGGDKSIGNQKDFYDAIMTRLWELGGGEYWYSNTTDRDVKLALGSPLVIANGDNFNWTLGSQYLEWSGLSVIFSNSTSGYNTITAGHVTLLDGYCIYVDVDRSTSAAVLTMQDPVPVTNLGSPTVPGSRFVIAWRFGTQVFTRAAPWEVGRTAKIASTASNASGLGQVRLSVTPGNELYPTVIPLDVDGQCVNTSSSAMGFNGTGSTIGVQGIGPIGVQGIGPIGVRGIGNFQSGVGVYGMGVHAGSTKTTEYEGCGVRAAGGNAVAVNPTHGIYSSGGNVTGVTGTQITAAVGVYALGGDSTGRIGGYGIFCKGGSGTSGISIGLVSDSGIMSMALDTNDGVTAYGGPGYNERDSESGDGVSGRVSGAGTGRGVSGYGGTGRSIGVFGKGGEYRESGDDIETSCGVYGVGNSSSGSCGVFGLGNKTASGVVGRGDAAYDSTGVFGQGSRNGNGVYGIGGGDNGNGVYGIGGRTNGRGVRGIGQGTGTGVDGIGGGAGGMGVAGAGTCGNPGGRFTGDSGAFGVEGFGGATGGGGKLLGYSTSPGAYVSSEHGPAILIGGGEIKYETPRNRYLVVTASEMTTIGTNSNSGLLVFDNACNPKWRNTAHDTSYYLFFGFNLPLGSYITNALLCYSNDGLDSGTYTSGTFSITKMNTSTNPGGFYSTSTETTIVAQSYSIEKRLRYHTVNFDSATYSLADKEKMTGYIVVPGTDTVSTFNYIHWVRITYNQDQIT